MSVPMPATTEHFELAESPVWDATRHRLLWVDILAGAVYEGALDNGRVRLTQRHDVDSMVGAVALADDGSLLVAARERLMVVRADGTSRNGPRIVPEGCRRRLNDGGVDPAGRFVVGTLSLGGRSEREELVRLEFDGRITRLDDDLTLSNGLAWSVDGNRMYSVDTLRSTVYVRDYDGATGEVGERRIFVRVDAGLPDGIALDEADHLWVAVWGGSAVHRYAPDGSLVDRIAVPAPHTSSIAFAGDDLRTLVITTASAELDGAQRSAAPDSGRLFTVRTAVPGAPVPTWAGRLHDPLTFESTHVPHAHRRHRTALNARTMRAFVVTAPRQGSVVDVPAPTAGPGQAVIDVEQVGVCGTDVELFTGEMAYLHSGFAHYPMRLGHEWAGIVAAVGEGVDPAWVGRRVMGDTMIGDGECRRCRRGHQHVCEHREEVGLRGGCDGALAEQLAVPVSTLHMLPDNVDAVVGALVEPAGSALRAARAAQVGFGDRCLVLGPGTLGLLVAMFLRAEGAEVHIMGETQSSLAFARSLGFEHAWFEGEVPNLPFDAVIDASNAAHLPALALDLVEPAGRLVFVGLAGSPSHIDTRTLVLKDVTAVGILSASPALDETIRTFAEGIVDPRPLVAATVTLDEVGDVLAGWRPPDAGPGPKIHIDPRRVG